MIITNKLKAMITKLRARVARLEELFDMFQFSAYRELLNAQLDPEIQISAEYNSLGQVDQITVGSGSTGATDGEFFATVGTGSTDVSAIFSKDQIIPRHGQGSMFRFAARFDAGLALSRIVAGAGTASDAVGFGYDETVFGTFYTHGGAVVVYELQVTGTSAGSEDATITINGTAFTVPLTNGTVEHNAFEIAVSLSAQDPAFNFSQVGDTVVMRSLFAAPETGVFTFSSGTATAVFTQIAAGVVPTRDFKAQTDWNVDPRPDLNPAKTNYYSIQHNGDIEYYIQDEKTSDEVLVHRQHLPNTLDGVIFGNASFRALWSISNFGNTTALTVRGSHSAAFIEGIKKIRRPSLSTGNDEITIGATFTNIVTIRNREVFGTKVNLGRLIPKLATAFSEGTKGTEIQVICDAVIAGETNFSYINESESITEVDTSPNAVSGGQLLASKVFLADTEIALVALNDLIQAGHTLTLAMRVIQVPASDLGCTIIWEEEF